MSEPTISSRFSERWLAESGALQRRLVERLSGTVLPVGRELGFAIGLTSGGSTTWLESHQACPCAQLGDAQELDVTGGSGGNVRIPIGERDDFVLLCSGNEPRQGLAALEEMVRTLWREIELEAEQESLLNELGACWESLDTLYGFSADLREFHETQQLLDRILQRVVSIHAGLKAILWIDYDGRLEAAAVRNTPRPASRSREGGLVGKTVQSRLTTVLNLRRREIDTRRGEPELANAVSLVVAPVGSRDSVLGALAIWHDSEAVEFDSPRARLIEGLAVQAAAIVESERFHHASLESARLRNELEIGARIQQMLLFREPPRDIVGLQLAVAMIPSRHVDGDFCEFIRHSEDCLDIVVGDVMGKGVPAALLGAATKSQILRCVSGLMATSQAGHIPTPAEIVNAVHGEISNQITELDRFVTLCYARIDLRAHRLDIVDCGHTRTVHHDSVTGSTRFLQGDNLPLGVADWERYQQFSVPLREGDLVVFYSDGITEARDPEGNFFGEDRLAETIRTIRSRHPDELIRNLHHALVTFSQTDSFADDLACVAVSVTGRKQAISPVLSRLELSSDLKQLTRMREWLGGVYAQPARDDEEGFCLLDLAVTEAFTNIIRHAFHGLPNKTIRIEAAGQSNVAVVTLSHCGDAFDPNQAKIPAFDERQEGGFGLYIISQAVDEVRYAQNEQGDNVITLVKTFRSCQQGEPQDGTVC